MSIESGYPLKRESYNPETIRAVIAEIDVRLASLNITIDAETTAARAATEISSFIDNPQQFIENVRARLEAGERSQAIYESDVAELLRVRSFLERLLTGNS